ncbi:UNVERIFIED_CONTAM: hypothetical protein RMT77_018618 [Armadillidium vulgare]
MVKKFQNISYDLSQNLILSEGLSRLDHFSLIKYIVHRFKNSCIIQEFISLSIEEYHEENLFFLINVAMNDICYMIHNYFDQRPCLSNAYINCIIYFVLLEVFQFMKRAKVYLMKNQRSFLRHLVLTNQGTVNTRKTVLKYFERERLSSVLKFKLAAQFFLEEKVVQFYHELSEEEKRLLATQEVEDNFAVYFWMHKLMNARKSVSITRTLIFPQNDNETREMFIQRINEQVLSLHIFLIAVKEYNESAVHYLWNNIISKFDVRELVIKNIYFRYLKNWYHDNIIHFLLLETEANELSFFDDQGYRIIAMQFISQRWSLIFPKVLQVLKVHVNYPQYLKLLSLIVLYYSKVNSSEINFDFAMNMFWQMRKHHENFLSELSNSVDCFYDLHQVPFEEEKKEMRIQKKDKKYGSINLFYDLLRFAFEEKNIDFIKSFFRTCPRNSVFAMFLSNWGLDLLEVSIKKCNFYFIEIFFQNQKFNKSQKNEIVVSFLRSNGYKFCENYLFNEFYTVKRFIMWLSSLVFLDKQSLKNFQNTVFFKNGGNLVKQMLFKFKNYPIRDPLAMTEKFFRTFDLKADIGFLKSKILLHIDEEHIETIGIKCYIHVRKLIIEKKWTYLLRLIDWKGCTDEEKSALGKKLFKDLILFEKMVKIFSDPTSFYNFGEMIARHLCVDKITTEYVSFKLKVFRNQEIMKSLIIGKDYGEIMNMIEWCSPTYDLLKSFRIFYINLCTHLSKRENDTIEEKEKRKTLFKWIQGKIEL